MKFAFMPAVIVLVTRLFAILILLATFSPSRGATYKVLWEIGKSDNSNREFALSPKDYNRYGQDGFFIVGESNPATDWVYVQPGPADAWAGSRPHTFTVLFGIKTAAQRGDCQLEITLLDTHSTAPPVLRIHINGSSYEHATPRGGGDDSIFGQTAKARRHSFAVTFPAKLLKPGNNRIEITTVSGSWLLYDALRLQGPEDVWTSPATPFTQLTGISLVSRNPKTSRSNGSVLAATIIHSGTPTSGEITLDEKPTQRLRISPGRQIVQLDLPKVEKARTARLALKVSGKTVSTQNVTLTPGVQEIVIVFKTHFDIGYTDLASNVVQIYRTKFMDSALQVADQSRNLPPEQQFVWTIPGWPMHKILQDWPGQTAERQERVRKALKEGRFVLHALPFTTHTELLEPEDLVRGLGYSSKVAKSLKLDLPRDAKMTDVPEHAAMMATLLHHSGVTFMHIGCNAMSGAPAVPPLYWWQGPDGTRVLTMYSPDYGTGLLPPADWPHRTWLALLHTGDNHGPPRPDEVKKVLDELAQKLPGIRVRIGRLSDFGDAILAEKPDLPVVRADMPDTWIHGPMSDPAGARIARNTRPLIGATEALNSELRAWGLPVVDVTGIVDAAYEQSLLYGEHTWGGSIGWLQHRFGYGETFKKERAAGRYERIEGSWDEHTAYIHHTRDLIEPALFSNLKALAEAVDIEGPRVVVFNPLPWKRSGRVTVANTFGKVEAVQASAKDCSAVIVERGNLSFFAEDIPPMGYKTYIRSSKRPTSSPLRVDALTQTIESPAFRAVLDPARGAIKSLVDKAINRELVDSSAPHGFGTYLYERFDNGQVWDYIRAYLKNASWTIDFEKPGIPPADEAPYRSSQPASFRLGFEQNSVSVAAVMNGEAGNGVPNSITTRLVLYRDEPFADLEITLHHKPLEPWPEAGWLCLPFKIDQPEFHLGRLGNIIDPKKDVIAGANRNIFGLNTGVAITDRSRRGVTFCPLDSPLVSLETPGCWKFSKDFVPRKPIAYVNLFNNQWNTNFRLWNSGTWTYRVRLWSFRSYNAEKHLVTPCLETRVPLLGASAAGPAGKLPKAQEGLQLSRRGIAVTAFGADPNGPCTLLRLWEFAGESGKIKVTLPPGNNSSSAQPVDLRGQPLSRPIPVKSRQFETRLPAFAPASFRLQ